MKQPGARPLLGLPADIHLQTLLPRIQEEKTRTFTTLLLTLVAIGIFGIFAISPTLSTITDLSKQLDDSKFVDNQLVEKIANLSKLQQDYALEQKDFSVVFNAIPTSAAIPQFLAEIQAIAEQTRVSLIRVQTLPVEITQNPTKPISFGYIIDATAPRESVTSFITTLSSFQRIATIDSISLTNGNGVDQQTHINIKGQLYFKQ